MPGKAIDRRADPARIELERSWLDLTRRIMPGLADERGWPVRADHCFQRILFDNACGGRWYDVIVHRPAYAHAADDVLLRALTLGEAVVAGTQDLHALNTNSLSWRRYSTMT